MSPPVPWRVAQGVGALLFLFSATLQLNDPDPWAWIPAYGAAAVVCVLGAAGRSVPWVLPAALSAAYITWAAGLAPDVLGKTSWAEMTAHWKMAGSQASEMGREMGGLLIMAGWMAAIAAWEWRQQRGATPA